MHLYSSFLILMMITVSSFSQQTYYEGELVLVHKYNNKNTEYQVKIKNKNLKIDFIDSKGLNFSSLLIDLEQGSIIELNNIKKYYKAVNPNLFEIPIKGCRLENDNSATKKILGYDCQKWIVVDKKGKPKIEYRIAKDEKFKYLKESIKYFDRTVLAFGYLEKLSKQGDYFIFSAIEYDKLGGIISKITLKKINQSKLDENSFQIPASYRAW